MKPWKRCLRFRLRKSVQHTDAQVLGGKAAKALHLLPALPACTSSGVLSTPRVVLSMVTDNRYPGRPGQLLHTFATEPGSRHQLDLRGEGPRWLLWLHPRLAGHFLPTVQSRPPSCFEVARAIGVSFEALRVLNRAFVSGSPAGFSQLRD